MSRPSVVVVGAGVVGTLTAHWLAQAGCEVTVVEQRPEAASGTSYANAGIVALGHAEAWGSPSAPLRFGKALLGLHPAIKVSHLWDPALWRWGWRFLRECTPARYRDNSNRLLRLCEYSADLLREVADTQQIHHHRLDRGALYLFRDPALFRRRVAAIERDPDAGRLLQVLGPDEAVAMDGGLQRVGDALAGALFSRKDLSGDCRLFTLGLAKKLALSGKVTFRYDTRVRGFEYAGDTVRALNTGDGQLQADQWVICAGNETTQLLRGLGIYVPIYPVKGYSMTFPVLDADEVPRYPAIDEDHLVSYALYGDRLRMTSIAEFAGYNDAPSAGRIRWVADFARSLCGEGLDYDNATAWAGLRPSTPPSTPYIGRLKSFANLWVNAGHGQLGWSMSAGSSRLLADTLLGHPLAINTVSAEAAWLDAL